MLTLRFSDPYILNARFAQMWHVFEQFSVVSLVCEWCLILVCGVSYLLMLVGKRGVNRCKLLDE